MWRGLIETYRDRLPVTDATPVITLHEGDTPLLPAPVLSARLGCDVYLKVEGANPTGSFKDRGMTLAVSRAVEAQMIALEPSSTALDTAIVMPRSLNEPVGLAPSTLRWTSAPIRWESTGAGTSGVSPSPRVTSGSAGRRSA